MTVLTTNELECRIFETFEEHPNLGFDHLSQIGCCDDHEEWYKQYLEMLRIPAIVNTDSG
jgi:hypothetical protein